MCGRVHLCRNCFHVRPSQAWKSAWRCTMFVAQVSQVYYFHYSFMMFIARIHVFWVVLRRRSSFIFFLVFRVWLIFSVSPLLLPLLFNVVVTLAIAMLSWVNRASASLVWCIMLWSATVSAESLGIFLFAKSCMCFHHVRMMRSRRA